jgi:hypothetical protein
MWGVPEGDGEDEGDTGVVEEEGRTVTLFDMTAEYQKALELMEAAEPGEVSADAAAYLQDIEADIKAKADGYCSLIRHYEALFAANANEASRLTKRADEFGRKAKWLKQRLHDALIRLGEMKVQTPMNTITVCRNGGAPPLDITIPVEELPDTYRMTKTVISPNSEAIRADLEVGLHVPGCVLRERGTHLRLK